MLTLRYTLTVAGIVKVKMPELFNKLYWWIGRSHLFLVFHGQFSGVVPSCVHCLCSGEFNISLDVSIFPVWKTLCVNTFTLSSFCCRPCASINAELCCYANVLLVTGAGSIRSTLIFLFIYIHARKQDLHPQKSLREAGFVGIEGFFGCCFSFNFTLDVEPAVNATQQPVCTEIVTGYIWISETLS